MISPCSSIDTIPTVRSLQSVGENCQHHTRRLLVPSNDDSENMPGYSYSDDFETVPSNSKRTDDDIHAADEDGTTYLYEDDFEPETRTQTPVSTARSGQTTARSIPTELVYSEEFDDARSNADEESALVTARSATRSATTVQYSEDFEETVHTSQPTTVRSAQEYSEDFETSGTQSPGRWQYSASFESCKTDYSETLESRDDTATSARSSLASVLSSPRRTAASGKGRAATDTDSFSYTMYTESLNQQESDAARTQEADAAAATFIRRKLAALQTPTTLPEPKCQPPQPNTSHWEREEVKALRSFCRTATSKVNKAHNVTMVTAGPGKPVESTMSHLDDLKVRLCGLRPETPVAALGISEHAINTLRLENTMTKIHQMATEPVHVPQDCEQCRAVMVEVAQKDFLRAKTQLVTNKIVDEKLAWEDIRCNDRVGLLGEVLKDLPKLGMEQRDIFERLLRPLEVKVQAEERSPACDDVNDNQNDNDKPETESQTFMNLHKQGQCPFLYDQKRTELQRDGKDRVSGIPVAVPLPLNTSDLLQASPSKFWEVYFSRLK